MMRRQENQHHHHHHQQQSRVLYELSSIVLNLLRTPPSPGTLQFSDVLSPASTSSAPARRRVPAQITPAGFASLMLGISLALMLCGSVTFVIGFMLLPWVIGLVLVFYFVGLVSSLSGLGRTLVCYATAPPSPSLSPPLSPRKDFSAWKFL